MILDFAIIETGCKIEIVLEINRLLDGSSLLLRARVLLSVNVFLREGAAESLIETWFKVRPCYA